MGTLIAILGDEAYKIGVIALVRSIGRTWRGVAPPNLRLLGPRWSRPGRYALERHAAAVGCSMSFANESPAPWLPVRAPYSAAVYARLSLARTCADAERVLCLDADIVALSSIHHLLEEDLAGAPVGAVQDPCAAQKQRSGSRYFNSGMMLVDLAQWDAQRFGEDAHRLLLRHGPQLRHFDQDALNVVLAGAWSDFDQRWNVFHFTELNGARLLPVELTTPAGVRAWQHLEHEAWCMHYVGARKPWCPGYPLGLNLARFKGALAGPAVILGRREGVRTCA